MYFYKNLSISEIEMHFKVPAMSPPHLTAASLRYSDVHDEEEYKQFISEDSLP